MRIWVGLGLVACLAAGCGDSFTTEGTGGAGGTTSSGTGPTGGGGTGGSGGTTGTEDCRNGVDDDGNNLVDCQDPACDGTYLCVPVVPGGWLGVGWKLPNATDLCPSSMRITRDLFEGDDLEWSPAECDCDCDPPHAVECASVLACGTDGDCVGAIPGESASTTCGAVTFSGSVTQYCIPQAPAPQGGACTPQPTTNVPPVEWPASGRACLSDEYGECPGETVCALGPPAGTDTLCIARVGDQVCPNGYPDKEVHYTGSVNEQRGCTTCSCGDPTGANCANQGTVDLFDAATCTGPTQTLTVGACGPVTGPSGVQSAILLTPAPTGGSCAASGVVPDGAAWPGEQITLCCRTL